MERIAEIQARLAEINAALDAATGEDLTALETESRSLLDELNGLQTEAQARQALRDRIAAGAGTPVPNGTPAPAQASAEERAANDFRSSGRMTIAADQARAMLISSGKLVTPTKVSGINDLVGAKVSSLIDLVKVVDCSGMGSNRVAYKVADTDEASDQTEGEEAVENELGTYDFLDIKPTSHAVVGFVSKQVKKQTNLQYAARVNTEAMLALRKKANKVVTNALLASELVTTIDGTAIGANTLRELVLAYGNDESIVGGCTLILNKKDLVKFGAVRGTNEKKALYEISPEGNGNTGTIKEGGTIVKYCLNSRIPEGTLVYGNTQALELDLFSDYEVVVSKDYAITKLMDTIVGDVELGADVVVKGGFVKYVIGA